MNLLTDTIETSILIPPKSIDEKMIDKILSISDGICDLDGNVFFKVKYKCTILDLIPGK